MENKFKIISLQEEDEKNKNDKNNSFCPTPNTKEKTITKPDFSPILFQETQFGFKTNGSYKRQKNKLPESPIKIVNKNYLTPATIVGRDLFGSKIEKSFCRKLNFNDDEDSKEIQKKEKEKKCIIKADSNNNNNSLCFNIFENSFINKEKSYVKQNKMENEFNILITIKNIKLDSVFMVEEKKTKKVFCIKKVFQNSDKNNINNYQKLFNDMTNKKNDKNLICDGYDFCNHFIDFWIEDENCDDGVLFNAYASQKYLHILNNYYPNGDLFDYLGKLELAKFKFTSNFYWDIIFEMLMGVKYFHELGYLHLDIKPTNFLVDEKGYLKLTDFGLCQRISEIPFLTDITEGDFNYISLELFHFSSKGVLDEKTDIFSLGLSILEIMAKIDLPKSGESWSQLRSGNFEIKEKLLQNWNIKENKKNFIELIYKMIAPIDKRSSINQLLNDFEELSKRYELLKKNEYKKSVEIPEIKNNLINCKKQVSFD
jgi:hypothetical protein